MSNFDEKLVDRLKRLEREVERLRVWERPAVGSGVTDHGALTGLSDDDHPQYLLTTGKAADSNKLNGQLGSYYLSTTGKAADSNKLNGQLASYYAKASSVSTGHSDYSSLVTITGWSPSPNRALAYMVNGKVMTLNVYIYGTSNAGTATFSLPSGYEGAYLGIQQSGTIRVTDNSSRLATPGLWALAHAGTSIEVYKDLNGASFTASGIKAVEGTITFLLR